MENAIKEFAKYLIDNTPKDGLFGVDIVDLTIRYIKEKENETQRNT